MIGGYHHSGVFAFPEDYDHKVRFFDENMELIEGLWFYDDGFHEVDNFEVEIEAMRPEGNTRKFKIKP